MIAFRPFLLLCLITTGSAFAADTPLHHPRPGLITAGQPSEQQLRDAAANGVTTLIDLRQPGEDRGYDEAALAEHLGLRYVRLPIAGAGGITEANARTLQHLLKQDGGKTLLHCASGNRVGALLAVLNARVEGAPADKALQLGREAGMTSLEPAARTLVDAPAR